MYEVTVNGYNEHSFALKSDAITFAKSVSLCKGVKDVVLYEFDSFLDWKKDNFLRSEPLRLKWAKISSN